MTEENTTQANVSNYSVKQTPMQTYAIPLSIMIAGAFIGLGLFFSTGSEPSQQVLKEPSPSVAEAPSTDNVRPVTEADHIKGDPNAPVMIVEYSDFECPFCKRFHDTMNQIMEVEGAKGEVAWVFRQMPLDQLHPKNARIVAQASECVAEQGGNDAFWKFTDGYMKVTPTNDRTDLVTVLPQLYKDAGVNQKKVEECIASGKYNQKIDADIENAIATGGRGTPWSVVIGADGKTYPLNGAQPIAQIQQLIKQASQ